VYASLPQPAHSGRLASLICAQTIGRYVTRITPAKMGLDILGWASWFSCERQDTYQSYQAEGIAMVCLICKRVFIQCFVFSKKKERKWMK
jgi:hypothetical protein